MKKVIYCLILTLLLLVGNLPSAVHASDITIDTTDTDLIVSNDLVQTDIMPGDLFSQKLTWNNKSSKSQKLYIYVDEVANKKLNEVLKLKITINGSSIIDCNLQDVTEKSKFIGEFNPSEQEDIYLSVYIDQNADNQYTMLDTEFSLYFMSSEKVKTPDSGDTTNLMMWVSLACVCLGTLYIMRKEREHEKIY